VCLRPGDPLIPRIILILRLKADDDLLVSLRPLPLVSPLVLLLLLLNHDAKESIKSSRRSRRRRRRRRRKRVREQREVKRGKKGER